jgi:hypothetical protein
MTLPWNKIGGGFVARGFVVDGRRLPVGEELSADRIKAFVNAKTLIRAGFLKIYPPRKAAPDVAARHVVHNGGGRYDVIAGVKLNDGALNREEAEALAASSN